MKNPDISEKQFSEMKKQYQELATPYYRVFSKMKRSKLQKEFAKAKARGRV